MVQPILAALANASNFIHEFMLVTASRTSIDPSDCMVYGVFPDYESNV